MQPMDGEELRDMLWTAAHWPGKRPIAVRYPRSPIPEAMLADRELKMLEIGKAEQLRAGGDVAILALGTMVAPSLAAAELLAAQGVSATVVNARFAAPLDVDMFIGLARSTGRIVTVEENVLAGGFGSGVSEMLAEHNVVVPVRHLGVPNEFVLHGKRDELLQQVGLDAEGIAKATLEFVKHSRHIYT
jgi:1-deoxy-D-xylulose-5-phosphate synthase